MSSIGARDGEVSIRYSAIVFSPSRLLVLLSSCRVTPSRLSAFNSKRHAPDCSHRKLPDWLPECVALGSLLIDVVNVLLGWINGSLDDKLRH
jgi:hypothetical protein